MSLAARLWQFLLGFAAFHLHNTVEKSNSFCAKRGFDKQVNIDSLSTMIDIQSSTSSTSFIHTLTANAAVFGLCACIFLPYGFGKAADRILTALLVSVVLVSEENAILSNSEAAWVGNMSYAVYLVHWPIFMLHKFTSLGDNEDWPRFSGRVDVCCQLASNASQNITS